MIDRFWQRILLLALPVAVQMLLQSLLGMADVAMVSDFGANAVASVGLAAKLHFLLLVLMIGVGTACSVLVAQYAGAKNQQGCRDTMAQALNVGFMISLPIALAFASASYWLGLINPDPAVVATAGRYLLITAPVVVIIQVITIYEAGLRATGNTLMPLVAGAIAVGLNIFFNYIFIFGHLGFEAMGVEGAAWATLAARAIQLGIVLGCVYLPNTIFALGIKDFIAANRLPAFKRFMAFAMPLLVNHAVWGVGNAAYHIATGYAGTQALAVMGVMVPVESAFFALFIGLANACAVMVGNSLGADKPDEAWRLHRFFDQFALALVIGFSFLLYIFRVQLGEVFDSLDAQTAALMNETVVIFCLLVWVKILNMMRILGVLRAGGDTRFCLVTDTISMWCFGIPIFIAAVYFDFSFLVLYALMFFEDALKCLPVKWRINRKIWLKNLTKEDGDEVLSVN